MAPAAFRRSRSRIWLSISGRSLGEIIRVGSAFWIDLLGFLGLVAKPLKVFGRKNRGWTRGH